VRVLANCYFTSKLLKCWFQTSVTQAQTMQLERESLTCGREHCIYDRQDVDKNLPPCKSSRRQLQASALPRYLEDNAHRDAFVAESRRDNTPIHLQPSASGFGINEL
jgi:hypothetical protein